MLRTSLILAVVALGICAGIYSRFAALLFYLWFAIFRPQEWVWVDLTPLRLSLVSGVLLVVPSLLTGVFPNLTHPLSIGCLAFLASALLAQTNAIRPDLGWIWVEFFVTLMVVIFLLIRLTNTRQRLIAVLLTLGASFGVHSANRGIAFIASGGAPLLTGLGIGAYVDNGHYAVGVTMVLPMMAAVAQNITSRWVRWGFLVAMPLSALSVIATYQRAGFLALSAAILIYVLLQRRRFVALTGLAVLCAAIAVFAPVPEGYRERIGTIVTYREIEERSALGRLHFWRVAIEMSRAHPFGIGLRNFEPSYDAYDFLEGQFGRNRAVHSSHFQVLSENGFIGFAAWLFLLGYSYRILFRIRKESGGLTDEPSRRFYFTMANAMIVSQSAFLVGGSFQSAAHNDITWFTFGLVAALDLLKRSEAPPAALPAHLPGLGPVAPAARSGSTALDRTGRHGQ